MSGKCDTQKRRSYPLGRADRRSPSTSTPSSLPRRQGRREHLLCWLMASGRFGCHDISQDTGGVGLPGGRAAASACWRGLARSLWWLTASSGCTARGVGVTGRGLEVLRVGGAFVQYAQPLASRSRPSWSRPTHTDSGRGRHQTLTTGTLRRRRSGGDGGEPVTEAPGCAARTPDSLLRGPVSTALTSTSPASVRPAGIVEILRFLFGVRRRYAFNVSTMDTSDLPGPARPLPFDLALASRTISPPKAPARASASEVMTPICLRSQETAHQETAQT